MLKPFMFCKHYKGATLIEKSIYQIQDVNISWQNILDSNRFPGITYTGSNNVYTATDLVVYFNIFQNKLFARELSDLVSELTPEQQTQFNQIHKVEKLSENELKQIQQFDFISQKIAYEKLKQTATK